MTTPSSYLPDPLLLADHGSRLRSISDTAPGRTIFVTGGTGFLGSHFINAIARTHADWSIHALVRGEEAATARIRLRAALRLAHSHCLPAAPLPSTEPGVVLGDIQLPHCGVEESALESLQAGGVSEFWHFASSLSFEEKRRETIRAHNIDGAMHSVALAQSMGCRQFIYVSTAYTAGRLQGWIPECLHSDIGFNNYYEETKNEAEHRIRATCTAHGMELVILRPSIVVGPISTKRTGGSSTGLYGFLQAISKARKYIGPGGQSLRIYGDPGAGLNLVPVDQVIDDILYLVAQGLRDGGIHHLTIDVMPTVAECVQAIREVLDVPGLSIEPFDAESATFLERVSAAKTVFYSSYLNSQKQFHRSIPTERRLTQSDVRDYVRAFFAETGGIDAETAPPKAIVTDRSPARSHA